MMTQAALQSPFLETIKGLDTQLMLWINSFHSPFFDSFMYLYTDKLTWGVMYAVLVWALWRNTSWKQMLIIALCIALCITLADQTSSSLIRQHVARLRPANLENPLSSLVHIVNGYRGGRYGFPSSHAANTFALCAFLGLLFRRRAMTAYLAAWALLNCYSRIYLGVHYPGDILAGTILGLMVGGLCYGILRFCLNRLRLGRPSFRPMRYASWPFHAWMLTMAALALWSHFTLV